MITKFKLIPFHEFQRLLLKRWNERNSWSSAYLEQQAEEAEFFEQLEKSLSDEDEECQ